MILHLDPVSSLAGHAVPDNLLNKSINEAIQVIANIVRIKLGKSGQLYVCETVPIFGKIWSLQNYPYTLDDEVEKKPVIPLLKNPNNPDVLWGLYSKDNLQWLGGYLQGMLTSYKERHEKDHVKNKIAQDVIFYLNKLTVSFEGFRYISITPPPQNFEPKHKACCSENAITAHRNRLHLLPEVEYKLTQPPKWWVKEVREQLEKARNGNHKNGSEKSVNNT